MGTLHVRARDDRNLFREPPPARLRCRARAVCWRERLLGLRARLSLFDVADEAADTPVLVARLAAFFRAVARAPESRTARVALRREHPRAAVHREAIAAAMGSALVHFLGLSAGGCRYLSALVRMD